MGKVWKQEHEAHDAHSQEADVGAQRAIAILSLFIQSKNPVHKTVLPILRALLPFSIEPLWKHPYKHPEVCLLDDSILHQSRLTMHCECVWGRGDIF